MLAKYRYELRRTNFHANNSSGESPYAASDQVYSRHRTIEAAERAQRRYLSGEECVCGCVVIVDKEAPNAR